MAPAPRPTFFSTYLACGWLPVFASRREVRHHFENTPYIQLNHQIDGQVLNDLQFFLQKSPHRVYPAEEVEALCAGANLADLKAGKDDAGKGQIALLDDRRNTGSEAGISRHYLGPLSATKLFHELRKPVRTLA